MTILSDIDEAINQGMIDPNHIIPEDLRNLGVDVNTSSEYLSKHLESFKLIKRGVYKRKYE